MNLGFFLECMVLFRPHLGYTEAFSERTELFLIGISLICFAVSLQVRGWQPIAGANHGDLFIIPITPLAILLACVTASCSLVSVARLGTFPIFVMAENTSENYKSYEDVFAPFFTVLGWACGRCLVVLFGFIVACSSLSLAKVVVKNSILVLCVLVAIGLNLLDGMRNTAVLAALILVFAIRVRRPIPLFIWVAGAICVGLGFIVLGNFRLGEIAFMSIYKTGQGPALVEEALIWFFAYMEPNLQNLNSLINNLDEPARGLYFISSILPDSLILYWADVPEPCIQFMVRNDLLAFPGLTFRTMFADIYYDFGYFGALIVGGIMLYASVVIYNRGGTDRRFLLIYLCIVPGICYAPLVNFFVHLYNLLPLLLVPLVKVSSRAPKEGSPSSPLKKPDFRNRAVPEFFTTPHPD